MSSKPLVIADAFQPTHARLRASLPQGILLAGTPGMNLRALAQDIAATHASTNYFVLEPQVSKAGITSISVEAIRHLYEQTRSNTGTQVIVIPDMHAASHAAQNAFLKLLEEPHTALHFILTTTNEAALLPTIISRVQVFRVPPLSSQQSEALLRRHGVDDPVVRQQLLFLASGLAEQLIELATWPKKQQEALAMAHDAKVAITADRYTALTTLLRYHTSRSQAETVIRTMIAMLRAGAPHAATQHQLARCVQALEQLRANLNTRLVLASIVV